MPPQLPLSRRATGGKWAVKGQEVSPPLSAKFDDFPQVLPLPKREASTSGGGQPDVVHSRNVHSGAVMS